MLRSAVNRIKCVIWQGQDLLTRAHSTSVPLSTLLRSSSRTWNPQSYTLNLPAGSHQLHTSSTMASAAQSKTFNAPMSSEELPRTGGLCSMMRLPYQDTTEGLDACFIGVPIDIGCGYKNGARMAPRQIRVESVVMRPYNVSTGAVPFESLQVADVGDIKINQYDVVKACEDIRRHFSQLTCIPLAIGGDHTITLPILQALKAKHGPMGLIHIDAHSDTADTIGGNKICHSTPVRRALEDGCIDPKKTVQIGLRGSGYSKDYFQWGIDQGFRVVKAEECWHKSLTPLMEEVRGIMGDSPVFVSFDIDALDPSCAPGTGTPEIGGLTTIQGMELIRGCRGLNIVGCDLVEVFPTYDNNNITSIVAGHLLFEMLCVLPGVKYMSL